MTLVAPDSTVVYSLAMGEHPLVVGKDDERTDEELIEEIERRTTIDDPLTWPEWTMFVSDPPDGETLRYVNTASRVNVKVEHGDYPGAHKKERDVVDVMLDHVEIEGWDIETAAWSHFGATHIDDFDGEIHLDLTN
jgi:hypothetical protein